MNSSFPFFGPSALPTTGWVPSPADTRDYSSDTAAVGAVLAKLEYFKSAKPLPP